MSENLRQENQEAGPQPRLHTKPKVRLRGWFWLGFAIVFLGMALFFSVDKLHPSGKALVFCPLWKRYAQEFQSQFCVRTLGPASGSGSAMVPTFLFHVLCSSVGGAVFAAGRRLLYCGKG